MINHLIAISILLFGYWIGRIIGNWIDGYAAIKEAQDIINSKNKNHGTKQRQ